MIIVRLKLNIISKLKYTDLCTYVNQTDVAERSWVLQQMLFCKDLK